MIPVPRPLSQKNRNFFTLPMLSFYRLLGFLIPALSLALVSGSLLAQSGDIRLTNQEHHDLYADMPAADVLDLADDGDPFATLELGNRLAAGTGGLPQNQSEAARHYSLAARRGFPGSPTTDGIGKNPIRAPRNGTAAANSQRQTGPFPKPDLVTTASEGNAPLAVTVSIDPNWPATAAVYSWKVRNRGGNGNNGNGNASIDLPDAMDGPSLTATFNEPGTYVVKLSVVDAHGRSAKGRTKIEVSETLVVSFPEDPVPIFPGQDALLVSGATIDFQWQASPSAETYDFHFFDGVTPLTLPFLEGYDPAELCVDDVCTLTLPMELPVGNLHAWRVRAVNSIGITGWSRQRFSVIEPITEAPSTPMLLAPDNATVAENTTNVNFGWVPSERAQEYTFAVVNASNETVLERVITPPACSDFACTLYETLFLPMRHVMEHPST